MNYSTLKGQRQSIHTPRTSPMVRFAVLENQTKKWGWAPPQPPIRPNPRTRRRKGSTLILPKDREPRKSQSALAYASKRKPVFPCKDKAPHTPNGFKDATTNPGKIAAWWNKLPDANIGLPTGKASGLCVLDFDVYKTDAMTVAEFEEKYDTISHTTTVRTGSGGLQFYFVYPDGEDIRNSTGKLGPHVDVRGEGGYILAPGSVTKSRYEWISKVSPAPLPLKVLEALREEVRSKPSGPERSHSVVIEDGSPIHEGTRDETLTRIAGRLHDGTRDTNQLADDLQAINEDQCVPPLPLEQVRKIARSVYRYDPCRPTRREPDPETIKAIDAFEANVWHVWRRLKGAAAQSDWSIIVALIIAARRYGQMIPAGVEVSISLRALALAAGCHVSTVQEGIERLKQAGLLRRGRRGSGRNAGSIILLTRAKPVHSNHRASIEQHRQFCVPDVRAPFSAPRLRRSTPSVKPKRGVVKGTSKVRQGPLPVPRASVIRMGKGCERTVDYLEREQECPAKWVSVEDLADGLGMERPRELVRRKTDAPSSRDGYVTRLEAAGVVETRVESEVGRSGRTRKVVYVRLTVSWLDALNAERERTGELEVYRDALREYNRHRDEYATRHTRKADQHLANLGVDGYVGELSRDEVEKFEGTEDLENLPVLSPLAVAIRSYLDCNPHDADQLPGWLGNTLWTFDFFEGKPTPSEVRVAIEELGGQSYLKKCLRRARGEAA
jgi:Bifunctional DNA primase/polymerase, N-terminal/Primase C terminal 1 (PriCT-1)